MSPKRSMRCEPVGERVFDALASPASSVPGSVVPRLGSAFSSMTSPVVLVLDDVHVLHNSECRAALSVLADHVPGGSRLVLAGRDEPPLRIARLRAEGRILEIGPGDLSLTREEASSLLRDAEVALGEDEVAELHRRTEGWPAGLYLAALYLREGGSLADAAVSFGGDDRLVSEYVESEFLARISRRQRVFLTRTAVLERMCGPLCEAVLDLPGSAATLADLARSNLLLVPLDRRGQWYRYHHLFRDMLLAELERLEPGLIPVLRRRAAGWCLRNGHARGGAGVLHGRRGRRCGRPPGGEALACRPTGKAGPPPCSGGSGGWKTGAGSRDTRWLAVQAAFLAALTGRPAEAERWADVVDRWQYGDAARPDDPAAEAWAAVLRAMLVPARGRADARRRRRGRAQVRGGEPRDAGGRAACKGSRASFAVTPTAATRLWRMRSASRRKSARTRFSRSRCANGRWWRWHAVNGAGPRPWPAQARTVLRRAGIEDSYATPLVCAVQARVALHRGDVPAARRELVSAQRLRPLLTYALPHLAVQARIELTRVHLALADLAGARTLMREIDELLKRRPGLGTLVGEAEALRARLSPAARFRRPRGVGADRRRAAPAADAVHPPVASRDRRGVVPLPPHRQGRRPSRSTASWASAPATTRCRRPRPSACSAL